MADYFTSDHFKLLNKWKGQKRDDSNPEQNRAYDELKQAYELTEAWANALQQKAFPHGRVEVRKRPTNQGNNFAAYTWAKIYPSADSPKELAYTVGIAADSGFVVKIDTVGLPDGDRTRLAYEKIRDTPDGGSPIRSALPAEQGLSMGMDRLVAWSQEQIEKFKLTYEQVCGLLDLQEQPGAFAHQEPMQFINGSYGVVIDPPPPKRKGHCMDVWVVSEMVRRELGRSPTREEVRNDPRLVNSNANNVDQEFYRWRKWWNEGSQMPTQLSDADVLRHFDGSAKFRAFRAGWSQEEQALFCRLARLVHDAGLDWWHVDIGVEVRFGRKEPGSERAKGVVGYVTGVKDRTVSWSARGAQVLGLKPLLLTEEAIARIKAVLQEKQADLGAWLSLDAKRPGRWPDELRDDADGSRPEINQGRPSVNHAALKPINRIYYGPPGTGKTYKLSKLLRQDYEQALSSVSGEEWRGQFISENIAGLTWWEGIVAALYDLGGRAEVNALMTHPFIQAISAAKPRNRNVRATIWANLQMHSRVGSKTVKYEKRLSPTVFDKAEDSTWHFVDDWREQCGDLETLVNKLRAGPPMDGGVRQRYSFITFHQSYGYEEFVEGLRPVLNGESEAGEIQYEIRSGVFKDLCRRARSAPDQRFAMVIDEINRGNISKIFGELITLIESDKREGAENAVSVTLPYSGENFSVPTNVDIIGTMNTADRSLALLDTALRRRFEFVPVMPDVRDDPGAPLAGLRVTSGEQVIDIPRMLDAINQRVEALYDRDHCIGHAYFTSLAQVSDGDERLVALQKVFSTRILPLLEEYFFEDWQKIRLVLADNQKPPAAQFVRESAAQEDDLTRLFGGDHGLNSYVTKRRLAVHDSAFSNPDAYIGIYQNLSAGTTEPG